ncbi:MAG: hypothetical protein KJN63_06310 [Acidimicrobiia bacterium]|nr:hypothetical protein [Acidimicrobiia bacterium]
MPEPRTVSYSDLKRSDLARSEPAYLTGLEVNLDDIGLTAVYFWNQSWKGTWRDFVPAQLPPPGMRLRSTL